jgi:hypothetical protein
MTIAKPVDREKVVELLKIHGDMKTIEVAMHMGCPQPTASNFLKRMAYDEQIFSVALAGNVRVWSASRPRGGLDNPSHEYIKVSSIWSVARRCAKLVELGHA